MEPEESDSSLQRSLEELSEAEKEEQAEQSSNESGNQAANQDDQDGQPAKSKKKRDKEQEQEDKTDYYAEYLRPDEDVDTNAPFVVVVQGSETSGKSSIIRSLIKHYTKYKIEKIAGTITLRTSKKQRITIMECPNDLPSMMDLAKVADIVLLVIDGSLGFQMETFQFLSLLKCHGFPHIMGVITHLDFYKDNKQLKKTKKKFKKRFEFQVGGNNKLFYLTKWNNGLYPKIEIAKIARYLGNGKPPSFPWRDNHPYIIADRWSTVEDNQYAPDDLIEVAFEGYIRGCSYRVNGKIHIPGFGDYFINKLEALPDPCPEFQKSELEPKTKGDAEDQESDGLEPKKQSEITKKKKKRRTLNQKERIIYAPYCNIGTLNYDHSSGYVTIPTEYIKFTRMEGQSEDENVEEGVKIVRNLQSMNKSINQKLKKGQRQFQLLEGVKMEGSEEEHEDNIQRKFKQKQKEIRGLQKKTEQLELLSSKDKHPLQRRENLQALIYESKEIFKTHDCSKYHAQGSFSQNLKTLFVTGMQSDVLKELDENKQKQIDKLLKQNYQRAKIESSTNFFQKGKYVRVVLSKIRYGSFLKLHSHKPLILSRVNLGEDSFGFLKVRFKRHCWYSNLLKSNDPIVVSIGWKRYQSLIVFAIEDQNDRQRYLKYSLKYQFCTAIFYGNFVQQNTGCMFSQTIRNDLKKFRIAGSGLVLEINKSFQVMKKIKLIGQPYKIMKNTAFIRGMFNSKLQVAGYLGAQIRTVSGIRGQIKKAVKEGGEGAFRATFEDKISISDIVFCRAWYRIVLERYYNPINSFEKNRLMKTKYQLRVQKGIKVEQKPDSQYKIIDRKPKTFRPFAVPKKLEARLPFKTVDKVIQNRKEAIQRAESARIPKLLSTDNQREVAALIQRLNTIKNQKEQKRQSKLAEKQRIFQARNRPRQQYYMQQKRQLKASKMVQLMKKKKQLEDKKKN